MLGSGFLIISGNSTLDIGLTCGVDCSASCSLFSSRWRDCCLFWSPSLLASLPVNRLSIRMNLVNGLGLLFSLSDDLFCSASCIESVLVTGSSFTLNDSTSPFALDKPRDEYNDFSSSWSATIRVGDELRASVTSPKLSPLPCIDTASAPVFDSTRSSLLRQEGSIAFDLSTSFGESSFNDSSVPSGGVPSLDWTAAWSLLDWLAVSWGTFPTFSTFEGSSDWTLFPRKLSSERNCKPWGATDDSNPMLSPIDRFPPFLESIESSR